MENTGKTGCFGFLSIITVLDYETSKPIINFY